MQITTSNLLKKCSRHTTPYFNLRTTLSKDRVKTAYFRGHNTHVQLAKPEIGLPHIRRSDFVLSFRNNLATCAALQLMSNSRSVYSPYFAHTCPSGHKKTLPYNELCMPSVEKWRFHFTLVC